MELPLFRDYQVKFLTPTFKLDRRETNKERLRKKLPESGSCQYVRLRRKHFARSSSLPDLASMVGEGMGAGGGLKEGVGRRRRGKEREPSEDGPVDDRRSQTASPDPELNSSGLSNDSKDNHGSSASEGKTTGAEVEGRGEGREPVRGGRGRRRPRGGKNRRRKQPEKIKKADLPGVTSPTPSANGDGDLYLPFHLYKQLAHTEVEMLAKKLHDYFEMQSSVYEENRMELLQQLYYWRDASEKSDKLLRNAREEVEHLRQLNEEYRVKLNSWRRGRRGRQEGVKRSRGRGEANQPSSDENASCSPREPQTSEAPPFSPCVGAMGDVGERKEDLEEPRQSAAQENAA